jgi:hypothetical protein
VPSDWRAPVVAYHDCWLIDGVCQPDHIPNQMKERIFIYSLGAIRLSVAMHVGCNDMISWFGERLDLMSPRIPGLRNPWQKRTKGPAPASAIWILMPFDSTNLCEICIESPSLKKLLKDRILQKVGVKNPDSRLQ